MRPAAVSRASRLASDNGLCELVFRPPWQSPASPISPFSLPSSSPQPCASRRSRERLRRRAQGARRGHQGPHRRLADRRGARRRRDFEAARRLAVQRVEASAHPARSRPARGREERPHAPLRASGRRSGAAPRGQRSGPRLLQLPVPGAATDVSQLAPAPTRRQARRSGAPELAPVSVDAATASRPVARRLPSAARTRSAHEPSVFDPSGFRNRNAPLAALFDSICQSWMLSGVGTPRRNTLPKSSVTCAIGPRYTAWCVAVRGR